MKYFLFSNNNQANLIPEYDSRLSTIAYVVVAAAAGASNDKDVEVTNKTTKQQINKYVLLHMFCFYE